MWNKLNDFYTSNRYVILWTAGYVFVTWAIMHYMFNFNIFSLHRWYQLMHAHLHGFAGLVFGILVLAMVPLYIATTILVARTGAPLFNLHIPQFIKNAFIQPPMDEEPANQTPATPTAETTTEPESNLEQTIDEPQSNKPGQPTPEQIPSELRVAYARARDNISRTPASVYDLHNITNPTATPNVNNEPILTESDPDTLPIPTEFDIDRTNNIINDVPVFTDLDFDDDEPLIDLDSDDDNKSATTTNIISEPNLNDAVIKYLSAKSVPYKTENDIIVTDRYAIATHDDTDFWVADNESWFAAGKTRPSPIASVLSVAATHNVQPILYLGADNIMDIDELRNTWERAGIRIITDLKDLG